MLGDVGGQSFDQFRPQVRLQVTGDTVLARIYRLRVLRQPLAASDHLSIGPHDSHADVAVDRRSVDGRKAQCSQPRPTPSPWSAR